MRQEGQPIGEGSEGASGPCSAEEGAEELRQLHPSQATNVPVSFGCSGCLGCSGCSGFSGYAGCT